MSLLLAVWVLVAPGEDWSWTITGGPFSSYEQCEAGRAERLDRGHVICTRLR